MTDRLELDLSAVQTHGELQELLFAAFKLPGWYGFNWNAFHDSITDPAQSTLPAVPVVRGWDVLARRLAEDARYLRDDLNEVSKCRQECRQVWVEPGARERDRGT